MPICRVGYNSGFGPSADAWSWGLTRRHDGWCWTTAPPAERSASRQWSTQVNRCAAGGRWRYWRFSPRPIESCRFCVWLRLRLYGWIFRPILRRKTCLSAQGILSVFYTVFHNNETHTFVDRKQTNKWKLVKLGSFDWHGTFWIFFANGDVIKRCKKSVNLQNRETRIHPARRHCDFPIVQTLPHRIRLQNDLYCVGWGVKLYSLTHFLTEVTCYVLDLTRSLIRTVFLQTPLITR